MQISSSTLTFSPEKYEEDRDYFSDENNQTYLTLNILSFLDVIQDIFGLMICVFNPWLLFAAVPMLFGDILSIYIVSLEKPFIFFESYVLENFLLANVMALDVAYDFMWLALWYLVSIDDKFFISFAIVSTAVFFADMYQVYTFIWEYGEDVEDEFEDEEKEL